jgi:spore germination cell wall hydrolase CwlJ-like protein
MKKSVKNIWRTNSFTYICGRFTLNEKRMITTTTHFLPRSVQNEVRDILDKELEQARIRKSKIRQARLIIKLKRRYSFGLNRLGMN